MKENRKPYWEVEAIIEERVAKESEDWDLDDYDIDQIRLETYRENGWDYDPKPYDEEEEEDDYDEFGNLPHRRQSDYYTELGMSPSDFF